MKNLLLIILFFGCSTFSFAQDAEEDTIYVTAEIMPEYKDDGINGFRRFIAKNYIVPEGVQKDLVGTVIVNFIVEKDGEISTIKVLRDLGSGTGEAAIEAVRKSEKWSPGLLNDKPVRVKLTLPIPINVVAETTFENNTLTQSTDPDRIYIGAEAMPEYVDGGIDGFRKYVAMSYRVPDNIPRAINGTIIVQFVVERDGTLSSIKVLRDLGYGTGEEAARVIAKSKKWTPGFLNNKAVRVSYIFPIILNVANPTMNTLDKSSNNIKNNSNDFNRSTFRAPKEFGPR